MEEAGAEKFFTGNEISDRPLLNLDLSISTSSLRPSSNEESVRCELKRQSEEQIRVATLENAYAERVREMTRRELELAEQDFARARLIWERAREEMEKVERMKEIASRVNSSCLEISCHNCHQRFHP
ncbi:protein indeterminate-domain 16-like [Zingiber officinale]|uniref:Uncharacterized protein n=1 Tax=Zingiber officinale TaxID=94328 RepID=A0A8J5HN93_ZINOF|nr:protein indeterminate-domain 16-like [Zingiber officinale]KAG6520052.1 hypothetical protein ZIOFF_017082 [Zingiber officinale]